MHQIFERVYICHSIGSFHNLSYLVDWELKHCVDSIGVRVLRQTEEYFETTSEARWDNHVIVNQFVSIDLWSFHDSLLVRWDEDMLRGPNSCIV